MKERRILVVEDSPDVLKLMEALLKFSGFDVVTAQSGENGLRLAMAEEFDLITLDVDLPDMDGFEVCRQIKNAPQSRETPVIFVSGRASAEDRQMGLSVGAVEFVGKPFETRRFVELVLANVRARPDDFAGVPIHGAT